MACDVDSLGPMLAEFEDDDDPADEMVPVGRTRRLWVRVTRPYRRRSARR